VTGPPQLNLPGPVGTPGTRHLYAVIPKTDGTWGTFCYACSDQAGTYLYPCRLGQNAPTPTPPPALLDPAQAAVGRAQKLPGTATTMPDRSADSLTFAPDPNLPADDGTRLRDTEAALAHIADQLGLYSGQDAAPTTTDIYQAIDTLTGAQQP